MAGQNYEGLPEDPFYNDEEPLGDFSSEPIRDEESVKSKIQSVRLYLHCVDLNEDYEVEEEETGFYIMNTITDEQLGVEMADPHPPKTKIRARRYQSNGYPQELGESESPEEIARTLIEELPGVNIPEVLEK